MGRSLGKRRGQKKRPMGNMPKLRFLAHARSKLHARRVKAATERVSDWLSRVQNPYIAFSTGKDSTCVRHLVHAQAPDTPSVYFDADCAFPESKAMLEGAPNLIVYQTEEPLLVTLRKHGIDGWDSLDRATMQSTVWKPIERLIAEYGFDGVALGLRADESRHRRVHAFTRGAVYQYKRDGLWGCQPIFDWSYDDVWAYIVTNKIPYCGVYDKQWEMPEADQRISYWAGETNRQLGRYAWLRRNYPELYARLVEILPEAGRYT